MPTIGSLFSGCGLLDAGLAQAGWEHAWLCESDPWRRDLLAKRFPGAVVYDDIRTLRGQAAANADRDGVRQQPEPIRGSGGEAQPEWAREDAPNPDEPRADTYTTPRGSRRAAGERVLVAQRVDLIAGGFPCRGASSAGKREGFDNAETVLWHEMRRVISELRPRYVLIENVAAILGMAASPGQPLGTLWGTVLGDLAALGFTCRWDCLPAAAVGAPHLRDRVFLIGERSGLWPM